MQFWSLQGMVPYEEARQLQLKLVEARARDLIPDTVLFLEHKPVVTRGKGLQFTGEERPRHMPLPELPRDIEFAESERGGDLTYHGPGQLVVYPICKLDGLGFGPKHDVSGYLRKFEQVLIDELAVRGISASAKAGATGVWTGGHKIASIGIAVKRWVTYHGAAINCVNNLTPFSLISPCGFNSDVMIGLTHLVELGPRWREEMEHGLAARLSGEPMPKILELATRTAFIQVADPTKNLAEVPTEVSAKGPERLSTRRLDA